LEDLESEKAEFGSMREFLLELRKNFGEEDEKLVKVAELKRIKQGGRTMEEFVQEFQRVASDSEYKERALVEEFKKGISGVIKRKLMEAEKLPTSIEQWYECATNLDRY